MELTVIWTNKFKKDYKRAIKRGMNVEELYSIITVLAKCEKLPIKYRDHTLSGDYAGFRECHIDSDWILIYMVDNSKLILTLARTGTHSDLL